MEGILIVGDMGQDAQILIAKLLSMQKTVIGVSKKAVTYYNQNRMINYCCQKHLQSLLLNNYYESLFFFGERQ